MRFHRRDPARLPLRARRERELKQRLGKPTSAGATPFKVDRIGARYLLCAGVVSRKALGDLGCSPGLVTVRTEERCKSVSLIRPTPPSKPPRPSKSASTLPDIIIGSPMISMLKRSVSSVCPLSSSRQLTDGTELDTRNSDTRVQNTSSRLLLTPQELTTSRRERGDTGESTEASSASTPGNRTESFTDENDSGFSGSRDLHEMMSDVSSTDSAECLKRRLQDSQRALKRTREHQHLQETRSRQLVSACAAKLREKQTESEQALALKDRQLQRIQQQLTMLQGRMKREQKLIAAGISEQEQLTQQQQREIERQRRHNRRLMNKVRRLSEPCSRCGTRPDSGISDCDDTEERRAAKVLKTTDVAEQAVAAEFCDQQLQSGASSTAESPTSAERGIMKTARGQRAVQSKTVTFLLQDNRENSPSLTRSRSAPEMKAAGGVRSSPPQKQRPPVPLKPRILVPASADVSGASFGQTSIVDTISQLLGTDLEPPALRRTSVASQKLSVIPEGADELAEPPEAATEAAPGDDSAAPRNVPRSRSNINLIMSEHEGVQIKENFEEFRFEDDMGSIGASEDSASDRSTDGCGGKEGDSSLDRRAGDGAESEEQSDAGPQGVTSGNLTVKTVTNGNYDKFLEQSGLSQKAIRVPPRIFSNHRSMLKPKDVKERHRSKSAFSGFTIEDLSPNSVRYFSEEL